MSGRMLVTFLALTSVVFAQQHLKTNSDPDGARLVTSDIPRFWVAFDKATLRNAGDVFQREYIDGGSAGLHDFLENRIRNGRYLAGAIAMRPRYYAAIRESTLAVDKTPAIKEAIRTSFRRFKEIYPGAVFPDVYFVTGAMNSGGTASSNGLLIGVEMNARSESTPMDELNDWERAVIGQIANLPNMVAHELIHVQQPDDTSSATLLSQALKEGGADFVGGMISDGTISKTQREYGDAHEQALWTEFRKEMLGQDLSRWFYQGDRSKDRPADMGYYVGYKICEAFYRRATDKREAVRRILQIMDPEAFLRDSGYGAGN
jgi:Predicted Zn-dependent protease (DUF2268)